MVVTCVPLKSSETYVCHRANFILPVCHSVHPLLGLHDFTPLTDGTQVHSSPEQILFSSCPPRRRRCRLSQVRPFIITTQHLLLRAWVNDKVYLKVATCRRHRRPAPSTLGHEGQRRGGSGHQWWSAALTFNSRPRRGGAWRAWVVEEAVGVMEAP